MTGTFQWRILQRGSLPLRPDGRINAWAEHRCSAALVWPNGEAPSAKNTIITDPCFTTAGYDNALGELAALNITFRDIGRYFITHLHGDHMLHLPHGLAGVRLRALRPPMEDGLAVIHLPGHHEMLLGLALTDVQGRAVWIVGDAILDEEWLRAWKFFWPNGYSPGEIALTWHSVAQILAEADHVIPGHGPSFAITPDLVRDLLESFPEAQHADQCPDVAETLRARLESFGE